MNQVAVPKISYKKFTNSIETGLANGRLPLLVEFDITYRCNLKCVHCYIGRSNSRKEMNTEGIINVIDKIADAGCLWMLLTGGEPLIREDFEEIYVYMKKKGFIITLFTNAALITEEIVRLLDRWRPFVVEATIYGMTPATYEIVTGVKGSLEKCIGGIKLLAENKIPLKLKTVALTVNKEEIPAMKKFARGFGLELRVDPFINPRIDGSLEPCKYRLSPEESVEIFSSNKKDVKELKRLCRKNENFKPEYIYTCSAGRESFHLNPYGEMSLCLMSPYPCVNLLNGGTFEDGWKLLPEIYMQKHKKEIKCRECDISFLCGVCPGWSKIEAGDEELPVEYLCKVAHLKAEKLGIDSVIQKK